VIDITTTPRRNRTTTRTSSRHEVELPCEVITSDADEPSLFWATDLSAGGLWLETPKPLSLGDEMVVCFKPSIWWRAREIHVFGQVARISPGLRGPRDAKGMGISFLDLTPKEKWQLRCWLRPRPESKPRRRALPSRNRFSITQSPKPQLRAQTSPFASRICW
jgi:Tfp pilus assembly protein PilZ